MSKEFLTPREVADLLGVSPITVRQWANRGWLQAQRTAGKHRRFRREEVEKFARERGFLGSEFKDKKRLLVVEDDQQLTHFLQDLFSDVSDLIDVKFASDGFEAGRQVEVWKPDLMLIDLMLPGIDGFEVCRSIKESPLSKGIRIIAMTGFHTEENVNRILEAGATHCLAKPFRPAELFDALGL